MKYHLSRPSGPLGFLLLFALFSFGSTGHAATFVVTSTADTDNGSCGATCTLRDAVTAANSAASADVITFDATAFAAPRKTITLGSSLTLSQQVAITGPTAGVNVDGVNKTFSNIQVNADVSADFDGLTLRNGTYGIINEGTATVTNCTLSDNGYIGIYNGTSTATVINCTLSGNGHFGMSNGAGTATVSNCTLSGNAKGGIDNRGTVTVTNCTLSGNSTYGIVNEGTATVTNCTLSGNGYFGIHNAAGTLTATNCTLSGNTNYGFVNNSTATVTNCTLSGNSTSGIGNNGTATVTNCTLNGNVYDGIYNNTLGTLTATNCTVSGNGSNGISNGTGMATVNNSLVVGNSTNINGTITGSFNITSGTADAAGLETTDGVNAVVLKDNGGPTQTIALVKLGTAVDAGNDANASATDQRGVVRPQGAHSDIGAFEAPSLSINDVTVTEGPAQEAPGDTTNAIFTVTLSVASSQMVTVAYGAIKGSTNPAVVSSDFLSTKGTLTFAPGEMTKTVTVPIVGDYVPEADETFIVKLSSPVNAPINDGQGLGAITNDDFDTTPPTVSFTTSTTTPVGTTPPIGGTVYNAIPAITGVAADAGSGIARVQLRLYRLTSTAGVYEYWNGTGWVIPGGSVAIPMLVTALSPGAGSANVTWTRSTAWPTGSNFADGTYYLTAYAFDRAGKFASSSRNFKKASDSTGPSVSFTTAATTPVGTTPVSGGTVSNTMPTITGIAADSASGVAKVELRLYRATATAGVYENWTGSVWTTTLAALSTVMNPTVGGTNVSWTRSTGWPGGGDFADGSYYLRATAYDKAGNLTATLASNFMKVSSAGQTLQPFATDEPSQ